MNTRLLVLLLTVTTIITLSIPTLTEMVTRKVFAEAKAKNRRVEKGDFSCQENDGSYSPVLTRVVGKSYFCGPTKVELNEPGIASAGYYKTDSDGILEVELASGANVLLMPETEVKIGKIAKTGTIDLQLFTGEAEVTTSGQSGRKVRVISKDICINPEASHFRVILNPAVYSGKVVVKNGMIRVTSTADSSRYFSLSSMFCLHFSDGILQVPHRAQKQYSWELSR